MGEPRISPAARNDLRDIRSYSKGAFGPRLARDYLDGLRETFVLLRDRPLIGAVEHDLGSAIRSFGYRSHRVYYREDDTGLLIVRILHHARNVRTALDS